jgi:hypothetical protein
MSAYTRRDALDLLAWGGAFGLSGARLRARLGQSSSLGGGQSADALLLTAVERNDTAVQVLLQTQVTDPPSPFRGSVPDQSGLHSAGSAAGVSETLAASFVHPRSRFHRDSVLLDRIRLATGFLERSQSPQGNIDLLTTNFNSPPDTGFVVHNVATAAAIGTRHGVPEIGAMLRPFLVKAGEGMAAGGVHTPNHRWVICSALAQVNELFPDARFVRRIGEWLAEGIDIDRDGQYTERSTLTYNIVTNRAFVVMAAKLKRPALLDPVRQNLRALMYLLHADGEVVTEISRRQDQYMKGGLAGYWFSLTYMAVTDRDGAFAAMARQAADGVRLSALLEYPELSQPLPAPQPLPTDYERTFADIGIARIRRGPLSATLALGGSSRLVSMRYGDAVVEGVRFATSFFGKGQFVPDAAARLGDSYVFRQQLHAPYYQPLARAITPETWGPTRQERQQTEINRLEQMAEVTETSSGFRLRARAHGTTGVPLALEIAFRDGGRLEGCAAVPGTPGSYVLERGTGLYRAGRNEIRFGPGSAPHRYVQLRGAEPKLPGESVYITGFTPFDRTITFECA